MQYSDLVSVAATEPEEPRLVDSLDLVLERTEWTKDTPDNRASLLCDSRTAGHTVWVRNKPGYLTESRKNRVLALLPEV